MVWRRIGFNLPPEAVFLALLAGLVYLPRVWELTYNKDDWYFMYDGLVRGAGVFRELALHTRPLRGFLYQGLYALFGADPLAYHLTSFLWRYLGGLGALWLFNLLWPDRRRVNFYLAALFLLFPGFLWWVSGFELQPNVISVGLQAFSIAFTLKAVEADSARGRGLWSAAAVLSGWGSLALVEYAIGMEGFRLLCVYLAVRRRAGQADFLRSVRLTARAYAVFLLIPLVFVTWYVFFFENWRKAQDAGVQLGAAFGSPLTVLWWGVRLLQSTLNISLLAWFVPFHDHVFANRLRDILIGLFYAGAALAAFWAGDAVLRKRAGRQTEPDPGDPSGARSELVWLGLLGTLAGVLPVVLANRIAVFDLVSQYTLPASLAGVLLVGGLCMSLVPGRLRAAALSGLIGLAALSHHALAARAVGEQETIAGFWWQVTWRAAAIQDDTLLVVRYPGVNYADNAEMVWGPANFIYNPGKQEGGPVRVRIPAARMEPETITNIVMGARDVDKVDLVIKYVSYHHDYRDLLVMTQPSESACLHVIDRRWPEISVDDEPWVNLIAAHSNTENIVLQGQAPAPPDYLFGAEPAHGWCYYYQKADRARQRGDWQAVLDLAGEVSHLGLHPNDQIEWMPFLQAQALSGNRDEVRRISTRVNSVDYYKAQACRNLLGMGGHAYPLPGDMQAYVRELFCGGQQP